MLIKNIDELTEEVVKDTSKEVFLHLDDFFDKFYNEKETIALLLITPKQGLAAYADRNINHSELYLKMLSMIHDNNNVDPNIQLRCASKCNSRSDREVPNLMIPFVCDRDNINPDYTRLESITRREHYLLNYLSGVAKRNEVDNYIEEFLENIKVDDNVKKNSNEKIVGCAFKEDKVREDKIQLFK